MADPNPSSETPAPKLAKVREIKLPAAALALEVAPDGKALFVACLDGSILRIDPDSGQRAELARHDSYASGVALVDKGAALVSAGYDGALLWHDLAARKIIRRIKAHNFWSWDLAASPDGSRVASVTGQYLAGDYRYSPAPEREPSVKVFDSKSGELLHALPHVPPVQAVAFSPDNRHLAAANLMGQFRVWELPSAMLASQWKTDDLTSWGVIKSHHFLGGVFAMEFSPDGASLYACGMGPMRDPMAGNGVQRWQRFDWRNGTQLDQTHEGEGGQGLMEALAFHPAGKLFLMAGRLFQGTWNLALFDAASGKNVFSTDAKQRITDARFSPDGSRLFLAKARHQELKDGKWLDFGSIEVHSLAP